MTIITIRVLMIQVVNNNNKLDSFVKNNLFITQYYTQVLSTLNYQSKNGKYIPKYKYIS